VDVNTYKFRHFTKKLFSQGYSLLAYDVTHTLVDSHQCYKGTYCYQLSFWRAK